MYGGDQNGWQGLNFASYRRKLVANLNPDLYNVSMLVLSNHILFLTFFLSLGGSFNALIMSDDALGTTETFACLFWMVN